jgi:hypothetical protein
MSDAELVPRLRALAQQMRDAKSRWPHSYGSQDVIYADKADDWADNIDALLSAHEAATPAPRHTTACRAYSNYQPPYEDCTCGAEAAPVERPDAESVEDWIVREARAISGPRTHLQDSEAVIQFGLSVARRLAALPPSTERT